MRTGIYTEEIVRRRLAFVQYLLLIVEEQISQPEPINSFGLLSLHDAIEMTLHLSALHLSLSAPHNLMEYWELLSRSSFGIDLEAKGAIDRINRARVGFKHQGNLPNSSDLIEFKVIGSEFIRSTVQKVFEVDFDSISLTDLIEHDCKEHLREAESLISQSKIDQALVEIELAFRKYKADFMSKISPYGVSVFPRTNRSYYFGGDGVENVLKSHSQRNFDDAVSYVWVEDVEGRKYKSGIGPSIEGWGTKGSIKKRK